MDAQSRKWFQTSERGGRAILLALFLTALPAGYRAVAANAPGAKARIIPLANSPREVRKDFVYPMPDMRQKLGWIGSDTLWRMTFPGRMYAFGAVELTRPVNLATERDKARLVFQVRPAHMAFYLSIGLVDKPSGLPTRAMTDFALQQAGTFEGDDWATVEIPLARFPADGMTIADETEGAAAVDVAARPFDWSSIKELRFIHEGGQLPHEEVFIKNPRITR